MAKKVKQQYGPQIPSPKLSASFQSLVNPDQYSDKYEACVAIDDTPECQAFVQKIVKFQNEQLVKDGRDPVDRPLCLKDEMSKNEQTGKWDAPTGRKVLYYKQADRNKFVVVGPDKKPIDPSIIRMNDTIRVNGQVAFGYMKGEPYLTIYLSAVQYLGSSGPSGVDAFDDESDGMEPAGVAADPTEAFDDDDVDLE